MTGSFEKIDYRLRPAKHAERLMLVELVRRMRFEHIDQYRYIGMGSVGFVDHRVFHRGLGLSDMISIEAASDESVQERFIRNVPLACIDLKFGHTSKILPKLDFDKKCVCWLNYDDRLSSSMSADIATIGSRLQSGSFLAVTFACGIPTESKGASAEMKRLREEFPALVSEGAKQSEFEGKRYADLGRRALGNSLERSLIEMDATLPLEDRRVSSQVCYFRYRDGAAMCTVGWVVYKRSEEEVFKDCAFDQLSYYRNADNDFVIKVPKFTPFEISQLERLVPTGHVPDLPWLKEADRSAFQQIYRYLPSFGVFEPV
ncbi:hypothetical protein RPE78_09195 [Thioclava litoralis]|uniref:Uncharacterized protein n=1 Tax=Thioclava litoralis TaxID=3076557 RepID=A0ABZ1DVU7_9RHOB|nr:hypothetical protein RPE78_09195 [Thioclava sp. FTW29]